MREILLLFGALVAYGATAQIETDRPDFTESPNVVPKGAIQLETGFVYASSKAQQVCTDETITDLTLNTSLWRYGIGDRTELRLNWSINRINSHLTNGGNGTICPEVLIDEDTAFIGLSPVFIGIKHNLHQSDAVSIGFLAHMYLPFTSTSGFEASRFAPEFLLPVSISVSEKLSVSFQLGMSWDGEATAPEGSYTLSLAYGLTDKLGVYLEPYGYKNDSHEFGSRDGRINGGLTYLLNNNFQLDVSTGIYKGQEVPWSNFFVGCGLSYIYQK